MWIRKFLGNRRKRVLRAIPRDAVCAEIGVWKGDFAARIRAVARPRELHLIDQWRFVPAYPRRWYGGADARSQADMDRIHDKVLDRFAGDPRVVIHRQPSETAALAFADGTFDWVYIDADHSYEAVRADLLGWAPKIRPGGVLVGDDYTWRDEQGALPVRRAVDEFVKNRAPRAHSVDGDQYFIWL